MLRLEICPVTVVGLRCGSLLKRWYFWVSCVCSVLLLLGSAVRFSTLSGLLCRCLISLMISSVAGRPRKLDEMSLMWTGLVRLTVCAVGVRCCSGLMVVTCVVV